MTAKAFRKIATGLAEATATASGWLPIETAPKDGAFIDLWVYDAVRGDGERWPDCYWYKSGWCYIDDGDPTLVEGYEWTRATHWLPIPAPPPAPDEARRAEIRRGVG
jgi:hypothetical protein